MDWITFTIFLAACGAAASTGAMFQPGEWYDRLEKPSWTPPNWLFPLAWTALYLMISYAAMRVVNAEASAREIGMAIGLWGVQIAFNTLWSPIFFGLRRLGAAMAALVCLWLAVAATMVAFFSIDALAGWLFIPYLIWGSYAGALNWWIWRRNAVATPVEA